MTDFAALRERGLDDAALIAAFRAVPREAFVADVYANAAYADSPLPIECGQTIFQPYIVVPTLDAAEGDGTLGCPDEAPFDAIVAAASGTHVPQVLLDQLMPGGRIVMPIADPGSIQSLVKVTKREDGTLEQANPGAVRFVPLVGVHGFADATVPLGAGDHPD